MNKYSRLGIGVLIAVWATVLLVPPLQFSFRAQLQGSPLMWFSMLPTSQGLNGYWESHALTEPDNRDFLLQAALEYPRSSEKTRVIKNGDHPPETIIELLPSPVFPGAPARDSRREKVRRLAVLTKKFPQDATILAIYLRLAYPYVLKREPGEMNDAHFVSRLYAGGPGDGYRFRYADYSTADLREWISRMKAQDWKTTFVFFKHEDEGTGPRLASQFIDLNQT